MAVNTGKQPANLQERMNPNDSDVFYISWEEKLDGEVPTSDSWSGPDGFTFSAQTFNQTVTEKGVTFDNTNGVTISTTLTSGTHLIHNEEVTPTRTIRRGFFVTIDNI